MVVTYYSVICMIPTVVLDNSTQIVLPSDRIHRSRDWSVESKNSFQLVFVINQTEVE